MIGPLTHHQTIRRHGEHLPCHPGDIFAVEYPPADNDMFWPSFGIHLIDKHDETKATAPQFFYSRDPRTKHILDRGQFAEGRDIRLAESSHDTTPQTRRFEAGAMGKYQRHNFPSVSHSSVSFRTVDISNSIFGYPPRDPPVSDTTAGKDPGQFSPFGWSGSLTTLS